jgi:hypothetical protein
MKAPIAKAATKIGNSAAMIKHLHPIPSALSPFFSKVDLLALRSIESEEEIRQKPEEMASTWMKAYCKVADKGEEDCAGEKEGDGNDCIG